MLQILVLESQNSISLNEESLISVYHHLIPESNVEYLSKLIKLGEEITQESFPYPTYIFNHKVQSIVIILTQVLGLENVRFVDEVILGFLVSICPSEESQVPQIQFVEFLVEAIHVQLVNFGTLKHFKYQAYLMHLFFHFNYELFLEFKIHEE